MKTTEKMAEDTRYPNPNPSSPGSQPGKSKKEMPSEEDDDPLFDEDDQMEDFEEEEEEDEDQYEFNDRYSSTNLEDIYDYMSTSL